MDKKTIDVLQKHMVNLIDSMAKQGIKADRRDSDGNVLWCKYVSGGQQSMGSSETIVEKFIIDHIVNKHPL